MANTYNNLFLPGKNDAIIVLVTFEAALEVIS